MIAYSFYTNCVHIILIIHNLYILSVTYDVRMNMDEHK